jgi:hypothetical protein
VFFYSTRTPLGDPNTRGRERLGTMGHLSRKPSTALFAAVTTAIIALVFALTAGATGSPIQNGSFQTCDLTGWSSSVSGTGAVGTTTGGVDPDGCQGFVQTGDPTAAGAESYLNHTFYAPAGTRVNVWAHFGSDCNGNNGGGYDYAYVQLDGARQYVACDYPSGYGYEKHSWVLSSNGYHQFYAAAANEYDQIISSTLYIDNLSLFGFVRP